MQHVPAMQIERLVIKLRVAYRDDAYVRTQYSKKCSIEFSKVRIRPEMQHISSFFLTSDFFSSSLKFYQMSSEDQGEFPCLYNVHPLQIIYFLKHSPIFT